jgi:hypothetical protein
MKRAALLLLIVAGCAERRSVTTSTAPSAPAPPPSASVATVERDAGTTDPLGAEAKYLLPIPARAQAPESPSAGWCGETAIQEGLLYLGIMAPQRLINKAGRPSHPDLYATDIPVALNEIGVRYTFYSGGRGYESFSKWAKKTLDDGDPILAGVKILPTEHPEWGLDHFVTIVGYGEKGMLVNTTWGHRAWVADTTTKGLSLKGAFYGIRMQGQQRLPANAKEARLSVLKENEKSVTVRAFCKGLSAGKMYRLEQRSALTHTTEEFTAKSDSFEHDYEIDVETNGTTRFHCIAR